MRTYVVLPAKPIEVKARNPFEAVKAVRAEHPDLEEKSVNVVARSLVWEYDGKRWWK